ncbi:MAG: hypothetical protein CMJ59_23865 [Planctomycetaceae bacterium]|nr:hypothetical protein [Planctomycetaceae bacterium]
MGDWWRSSPIDPYWNRPPRSPRAAENADRAASAIEEDTATGASDDRAALLRASNALFLFAR